MKYFFQINNLETKESKFFDSDRKPIKETDLPSNITKVAMGFPLAILFYPPLKKRIYACVIDNAGRKQYFYTKEYKDKMDVEKFDGFIKMIERVDNLLKECNKQQDEISTAIMLMNQCNFRIGHEKYKKLYNTNGTLTLSKGHIHKGNNNSIEIEFLGKKKEENYCKLSNKNTSLYRVLNEFLNKSNNKLFKTIKYIDVYDFIKKYNLKPKDIRQVSANREFYDILRDKKYTGTTKKEAKSFLKEVLQKTSENMNHTPAVCKKKYLMTQWFEYEDINELIDIVKNNEFKKSIEILLKKKIT